MEQNQKGMIKYQSKSGQEITLSFELIRKYLVSGHPEFVTLQEMIIFMGICKERKLNPFARDCYLIKYTKDDAAAIVTSIDYFRSRAKAQPDCVGWSAGIIIKTKDGEIKKTTGLILEGEKLLGGWFNAMPKGWSTPCELQVNLDGYVKKRKDGELTRFWKVENQPTQIAKVAESQGLRRCWPDEFQQLYTDSEIGQVDFAAPDLVEKIESAGKKAATPKTLLEEIAKEGIKEYDAEKLSEFLQITAEKNDITIEDLIKAASREFPEFWKEFKRWEKGGEEKKPAERAQGELTDEEIIAQFKGLKHSGLMNWEKMHRDKLTGFSMEVQKAFVEKWKKVMGQTYHGRSEPIEPKEETEPGTEEGQVPEESKPKTEEEEREEKEIKEKTVECPNHGGELTLKSYCEDGCPDRNGCPVFE